MRLACLLLGWVALLAGQAPEVSVKEASALKDSAPAKDAAPDKDAPGKDTSAGDASPVIKAPGDKGTLELTAKWQAGVAPVVLKWEMLVPVQLLEMEGEPEVGSATTKSGKTLQCAAPRPYRYTCVLSGGTNPVQDGTIAIFHFKVRPTAKAGSTAFRIQKVEDTTADTKVYNLDNIDAQVFIGDAAGGK